MKKKITKPNNFNELIIRSFSMVLPLIYNTFKDSIIRKNRVKFLTIGISFFVAAYFIFINKNNNE